MANTLSTDLPGLRFDSQGKWLPFTIEETKARGEALQVALDKLDESSVADALSDDVLRAIDSHRPERRLFEGMV